MIIHAQRNSGQDGSRIVRHKQSQTLDLGALEDFGGSGESRILQLTASESPEGTEQDGSEEVGEDLLEQLDVLKKQVLEDAQQEANQLLMVARERAIKVLEEAKQESEQIREQATRQGHQQGFDQGYQDAQTQIEDRLQYVQTFVEQLRSHLSQEQEAVLNTVEQQSVALSLALAQRIVASEISTQVDAVAPLVRQGLRLLTDASQLTIWSSAEDVAFLREHRKELLEAFDRLERIHIQVDEQLQHGECLIESDTGLVDATIAERFRLAEQALSQAEIQMTNATHVAD